MRQCAAAAVTILLLARGAAGQIEPQLPRQAASPSPAPSGSILFATTPPSPFMGSVPSGSATSAVLALSLPDAIARGLKSNLGQLLASQDTRAVRGARWTALSQLLPNLGTRTAESSQEVNIAAFGFSGFPGVPQIIGPFGIFDSRAILSQSILNFRGMNQTRAATEGVKAADFSYQDARDTVVLVVTSLYLQAATGASRVDAALAQVETAQAVYNQAVDLQKTGVVPAIEVLRAQVELQAQQQRLIFFRNEFEKQKLRLARAIGLPDGQAFELADKVPYAPGPALNLDDSLQRAFRSRMDYQSASARMRAAELARKAAESERLPSMAFNGDYGTIGPSINNSHGTFTAAVSLTIPVFQGGRVRGEVLQADALLEQRKAELEDLRGRIAFEIRSSLLDLNAAGEQVNVAKSSVDLAQRQITQAQDRFAAGVTSNLEVVQAQEALATANENYISGLYAYNAAKATLARAMGGAEKTIPSLLEGVMP